jgi:hypothetical protein
LTGHLCLRGDGFAPDVGCRSGDLAPRMLLAMMSEEES